MTSNKTSIAENVLRDAPYAQILSEYCEQIDSEYVRRAVKEDMFDLIQYVKEKYSVDFLEDVQLDQLKEYRFELVRRKLLDRQLMHKMNNIGRFYSFLYKQGYIENNPTRLWRDESPKLKNIAPSERMPGENTLRLSEEQVSSVLGAVEGESIVEIAHRAVLQFLLTTSLRPMELINLKRKHYVRSGRQYVLRFPQKVGMDRTVTINWDCKRILEQYFHQCAAEGIFLNEEDYLFTPMNSSNDAHLKRKYDLRSLEMLIVRYLRKARLKERLVLHPWKPIVQRQPENVSEGRY